MKYTVTVHTVVVDASSHEEASEIVRQEIATNKRVNVEVCDHEIGWRKKIEWDLEHDLG